jgi:hypothetical protein
MSKYEYPVHVGNFLLEMKPLYYVAKIFGLAPFALNTNPMKNEEIIDIKFISNIGGFTVSGLVFVTLLTGFVIATVLPEFSHSNDPADTLCHAISVPLNFIGSLILVIMNATVNRYRMEDLLNKLTLIDENLYRLRGECTNYKGGRNIQLYMPILLLTASLISFDAFVWSNRLSVTFCVIERSSHVITVVAAVQYCKVIQIIRSRLSGIHKVLSSMLSNKLSQTSTSYVLRPNGHNATNKVDSLTSNIMQVASVDVLSNPVLFTTVTADLKALSVTEMQTVLNLRRIYNHLYECAKIVNCMYGLPILVGMSRAATGLISALYSVGILFTETTETDIAMSRIIWTVILLGTMIFLTVICEMAASRAKGIGHKVQTLLLQNPLRSDVLEQLKLFCQQISNDRIEFTAAGFFVIDLSLLCTFLTSVATYIVVLIQFKSH